MKRIAAVLLASICGLIIITQPAYASGDWTLAFDNKYHALNPTQPAAHTVSSTQGWYVGDKASSYLIFQSDCNLVARYTSTAVWASNTAGLSRPCTLRFQGDANIVIYDSGSHPHWATNQTWGNSYTALAQFVEIGECFVERKGTSGTPIVWRNRSFS